MNVLKCGNCRTDAFIRKFVGDFSYLECSRCHGLYKLQERCPEYYTYKPFETVLECPSPYCKYVTFKINDENYKM